MHMCSNLLYVFTICLLIVVGCNNENEKKKILKEREQSSSQKAIKDQGEEAKITNVDAEADDSENLNSRSNRRPVIRSITIVSKSENDPRQGFKAIVEAFDPDQDDIGFRYQWKLEGDEIIGAIDEEIDWQEDFIKGSNVSVEVVPFDGIDEGVWKAEGSFTIPNSPPKILSEPKSRIEGGKFTYVVQAEDPDGDSIEFTLKSPPRGMTIEPATGLISWEFDEEDIGEHAIEIVVSDSQGAKSTQTLNLNISSGNKLESNF